MSILKRTYTLFIYLLFVFYVYKSYNVAYMDAPHPWQVGFQDPATPIMEGIISFNGLLMTFMLLIACFVGWLLYQSLTLFNESANPEPASFNHSTLLEIVWTIIPAGILMIISVPSYNLLYAMEEVIDPTLTIKVVGHQWYWSYEYSDFELTPRIDKDNLRYLVNRVEVLDDWLRYLFGQTYYKGPKNVKKYPLGTFNFKNISAKGSGLYGGKSSLIDAKVKNLKLEYKNAEEELNQAGLALKSAQSEFKSARVDLAAAKLNKSSAEVIKSKTEFSEFSSSVKRPSVLLKDGFDGWDEPLRLKTKENSDILKSKVLKSEQEFESDSSILDILSIGLSPKDVIKANAVAKSTESEFYASGDKLEFPYLRSNDGGELYDKATDKFKEVHSVFELVNKKFEKAVLLFDKAKNTFCKKYMELFAYLGLKTYLDPDAVDFSTLDLNNYKLKMGGDESSAKFNLAKNELSRLKDHISKINEELTIVNTNLEIAGGHAKDVTKDVMDTPFVDYREKIERLKVSETYFDNFTWDRHKTDLLEYENKLRYGNITREEVQKAMEETLICFYNNVEIAVEADLESIKSFLESPDLPVLDLSYAPVKNDILALETHILKAADKELLFTNKLGSLLKDKISADLKELRLNHGFDQLKLKSIDGVNNEEIYSCYADIAISKIKHEVDIAENDYNQLIDVSTEIRSMVKHIECQVARVCPVKPAKEVWSMDALEVFLNGIENDVDFHLQSLKDFLSKIMLLDIKVNSNLMATKLRTLLLQSKVDLENLKSFSDFLEKVAKEGDNCNSRDALIMMYLDSTGSDFGSAENPSKALTGENLGGTGDSDDESGKGNGGINKKKTTELNKPYKKIKKLLDRFDDKDLCINQTDLLIEILSHLKDMTHPMGHDDVQELRYFMYKLLATVSGTDTQVYPVLKMKTDLILGNVNHLSQRGGSFDKESVNFDSYLIADDDLVIPRVHGVGKAGKVFRLLEVDNRLFVPVNTHIRVLVTSADVLHSWAVPSLGIKVDACPGRLNQVFLFVKREGVFYGQCSEICGVNHGFMPIVVQAVNQDDYLAWLGKRLCS